MKRYAAFLRAINLGGKTKVSMAELKRVFADIGCREVTTVLNSGNVIFSASESGIKELRTHLEDRLYETFGFKIPIYIIELNHLREILDHAPCWWNTDNKKYYHNLMLVLSGESADTICELLGSPSVGKEYAESYDDVIFWSYDLSCYQKCNWWKATAKKGIAEKLTIRTGNTIKRICR